MTFKDPVASIHLPDELITRSRRWRGGGTTGFGGARELFHALDAGATQVTVRLSGGWRG
jgi:hypothetical protein